ncbi:winged helix-turn-helix transcriptional regulator [Anaerosacchariphilus polymeriproducens]|uniref:Transcriptional regulator n=1 Tax=Anaerosacchariphilus polymeriproducens TaxID=1812858 RepID=A0A371AQQ4_9FIRM|nr:helix-turn-helix domain-containing protein [Anaerosacchariphilus polymeriproducens]RDU21907.1 transcriptional regulator [Anaerosacchariphilus polymeriproducens]
MKNEININCPVVNAVNVIGGKYKIIILYHLSEGTLRFNELQKRIPYATPKMLTQQLRELERDKLISRTVYPVVPPKTEYALTDYGKSIMPVLEALCDWGKTYLETPEC